VVALVLGTIVVAYYLLIKHDSTAVVHAAVEDFSFVSLLTALFVIAGGIHIRLPGRSTPLANTVLLALGAVLANVLGTTGASMLLIRPYLRLNKYRIKPYHVVFFIFLVSNIGGALTPIGDPPLFLGYLKGVPFFWVMNNVLGIWLPALLVLLVVFYGFDWWNFRRAAEKPKRDPEDRIVLEGTHNFLFLFLILAVVLAQGLEPGARLPQTLVKSASAVLMLAIAATAYRFTPPKMRAANEFDFHPILEVAIIFAGIFATMTPALEYLEHHATSLGLVSAGQYYWGTGILSAVLDNAPTYLDFLAAACGLHGLNIENPADVRALLVNGSRFVQAISVGALTYIGNGPNFMVSSNAERAGMRCPSFFGYFFKYALPILLPLFLIIYWFAFR
jgi:Na+/H+ antiporter NhaD/arsenite permease-like protein